MPTQPTDETAGVSVLTWVTLGAGTGLLAAGLLVGLNAQGDFDDWKGREIETPMEAARADSDFETIEGKSTASTVLVLAGGAVLAIGGGLLALDLMDDGDSAVALAPWRDGVALRLHARTRGL
jgi:hypothetical protein